MTYYIATNIDGDYLGDGDVIPFCSEGCRNDFARRHAYGEALYMESDNSVNEYCAECGVVMIGPDDDWCECQRDNIVVNRFISGNGERCEHDNWIQLPAENVGREWL